MWDLFIVLYMHITKLSLLIFTLHNKHPTPVILYLIYIHKV